MKLLMTRGRRDAARSALAFALGVAPLPVLAAGANQPLTQVPPRSAATTKFEAQTSTIAPTVEVPFGVVDDAANAAADRFSGPRSGKTHMGCQKVGFGGSAPVSVTLFQGCADFDWNVDAARNGNITVKRAGDKIAMDVPVKFNGTGDFVGQLAKAIHTGPQKFKGTFVVSISGNVAVDKSFCPRIENAIAHFSWDTPPDIDIIGRSCLKVGHGLNACIGPWKFPAGTMMTDQINHSLQQQVDDVNSKIPCNSIRGPLQQVWKNWAVPVPLTTPPIYVTIQPKDLSVSNVSVTDNGLKMSARLDAQTAATSTPPPPPKALPLPQNTPVTSQASRFSVAIPVPVPYTLLAAAGAGGIVGKLIRAGATVITPTEVTIYPDHDQLAVGVTVRDDAPGHDRGKTGVVWYTATPTVDDNGHAIRLGNVTMAPAANTPLWHAVSAAVNPALGQAIAKSYSYDFSGLLKQAQSTLNQALANPKNTAGLLVRVSNDNLRLGHTANLPGNFVIGGLFSADLTIAPPKSGTQSSNSQSAKAL